MTAQADANYWAMKIFETHPCVAKALARRFPEMIVGEAQDTMVELSHLLRILLFW